MFWVTANLLPNDPTSINLYYNWAMSLQISSFLNCTMICLFFCWIILIWLSLVSILMIYFPTINNKCPLLFTRIILTLCTCFKGIILVIYWTYLFKIFPNILHVSISTNCVTVIALHYSFSLPSSKIVLCMFLQLTPYLHCKFLLSHL